MCYGRAWKRQHVTTAKNCPLSLRRGLLDIRCGSRIALGIAGAADDSYYVGLKAVLYFARSMLLWARDQPELTVRSATVALVALTLGGTLACSAADPLAPPTVLAPSLAAQRDPLDITGSWVTSPFVVWDWLPGTVPDPTTSENLVHCESYAIIENEEWNSLLLKREGTRVTGTSRPGMGISCYVITPEGGGIGWFVDIDAAFEGQVIGNEVRLALNKYINVRVKPDLIYGGWAGTIRVRMDPRPYADPYWIEQPFSLRTTSTYPCWWVHLQPPYCIEVL